MANTETLGNRIRVVRKCLGKTQTEMASLLGIKRYASISRYEDDSRKPDHAKLETIAKYGSTTIDWLLTGHINREIGEKINSTIMGMGKGREVSEKISPLLNVTPEYISAICNFKIEPSETFIDSFCNLLKLNKYEVLSGTNPHLSAMPSLKNSSEDYEIARLHQFEGELVKINLFEEWNELRDFLFNNPNAVERLLAYLKNKDIETQLNEKAKYYEGQIDLLRDMLHKKTLETNEINFEKATLKIELEDLKRQFKQKIAK